MNTPPRLVAALVASAILLTGCAASSVNNAPEQAPAMPADAVGGSKPAAGEAARGTEGVPYTEGGQRQVVRTASLTLVVDDVAGAAEQIRALAPTLAGWVTGESLALTGSDGTQPARRGSSITLSVPASRLDDAVARVGELGTVRDRQATAEDVTDAVVDLDARITSLEASVARLQELVGRAGSVADIAAVERELSSRQADLEAMKSQRLRLAGLVERSSLTIALLTPTQSSSTNPIQTGWARGWETFLESVAILITVVAALLPFALLVGLVAAPIVWLTKRRRRARAAAAEALRVQNPPFHSVPVDAPASQVQAPAEPGEGQGDASGEVRPG